MACQNDPFIEKLKINMQSEFMPNVRYSITFVSHCITESQERVVNSTNKQIKQTVATLQFCATLNLVHCLKQSNHQ